MKIFAFLRRRSGSGEAEFHAHWRHPHGTLAKDIDTFRRYVQAHKVDAPGVPGLGSPHDGAAELWFDSLEDATSLADNRYYAEVVVPDEQNFIELGPDSFRVLTREMPIAERGFDHEHRGVKLVHCIRLENGADPEAFPGDGEEAVGTELGATRHVVCRAMPETYGDEYVPFDGRQHQWLTAEPFDAIRELWWPDLRILQGVVAERPDAWSRLLGAGIDTQRSSAFVAEEHVVIS